MAGHGAPSLTIDGTGLRVAIIAGNWHTEVMNGLVAGAVATLTASGADHTLYRVAGAFELPLAAQAALEDGGYDAAVCLGVIIRGETPHFDYVATAVTDGLTRVQLDSRKPVGFGVLTTDDDAQALNRAGLEHSKESKGAEAAEAALYSAAIVRGIRTAN